MDCHHARELAESFLGGNHALPPASEVLHHLRMCQACRVELEMRQRVRESVRTAFGRAESLRVRPEFVSTLRTELHARAHRRGSPHWRWLPVAALAAAAVWVLVVGFGVRDVLADRRFAALASDAVGDHQNCVVSFRLAERPISLAEAGRRFAPFYSALSSLSPQKTGEGGEPMTVLARHACVFDGRRFAHVVVRYRGALGSVLVTSSADVRGRRSEIVRLDGLSLVSLPTGDHAVFIVCPLNDAGSRDLAEAFERPITEALAGF